MTAWALLAGWVAAGLLAVLATVFARRLERARREVEAVRLIIDLANDAVLLADISTGRIVQANPAARRLLGRESEADLLELTLPDLHPPEMRSRSAEIVADVWETKGLVYSDLPFVRGDGEKIDVEVSANVADHLSRPTILIFARDIRARREHEREIQAYARELEATNQELRGAQLQLVQAEKMASLGSLAAGVAHEINTPIGAIHSNVDVTGKALGQLRAILDEVPEGAALASHPKFQRLLSIVEQLNATNRTASERIAVIVRSLRNFARLDEAEHQHADLHEGIESTLALVRHQTKDRIEIVRDFGQLPQVGCFPNQINQVFMNLLVNGLQAIEGEGTITVTTRHEGEEVVLGFTDTGKGISKEHIGRIFDPGFTTKGVGVGTGLGLSICYRIVSDHGGTIAVDSEVGRGTTFTIRLPVG